jgi:hypothetical protein
MIRLLFLLLIAFIGGWVAWPGFSAYQIYDGMNTGNVGLLERKINWDSLRTSLRPVVAAEVDKSISQVGGNGVVANLSPELKEQLAPQITDLALKNIVTPKGLIEIMKHGGDVSKVVSDLVKKHAGGLGALSGNGDGGGLGGLIGGLLGDDKDKGGLGGLLGNLAKNEDVRKAAGGALSGRGEDDDHEVDVTDDEGPQYGFENLKRFAYPGIDRLEVGLAKEPTAEAPDMTAVMEFQDFDWKLTGLLLSR